MVNSLFSVRLVGLLTACLLGCVLVGCQKPNEALVHQMEELKKELADLKASEKKLQLRIEISQPFHRKPRPSRGIRRGQWKPLVLCLSSGSSENASQGRNQWSPSAPVAKALQPNKQQSKKVKKQTRQEDIALPTPEVPPLVFQTLDEYGQVHGMKNRPVTPPPSAPSSWAAEEEREPEVKMMGSKGPIDAPELLPVAVSQPEAVRNAFPSADQSVQIETKPTQMLGPESHPMTLVATLMLPVKCLRFRLQSNCIRSEWPI